MAVSFVSSSWMAVPLALWTFGPLALLMIQPSEVLTKKKPSFPMASRRLAPVSDILMDKPGYAIATEGFHELSVDVMNTSFSLVSHKYSIQTK